jgi:hypothetical protein
MLVTGRPFARSLVVIRIDASEVGDGVRLRAFGLGRLPTLSLIPCLIAAPFALTPLAMMPTRILVIGFAIMVFTFATMISTARKELKSHATYAFDEVAKMLAAGPDADEADSSG